MQRIVKRRVIRGCLVSGLAAIILSTAIGLWEVTGETRRVRGPDLSSARWLEDRAGPPVEFEVAPVEGERGVMLTR